MIKCIKKHQQFLTDVFLNTASFAIYILSQQVIFMPSMGKLLSEADFAKFIIFVSIFSILSNSLGGELGIVRQIFEHKKEASQYNRILRYLLIAVFLISLCSVLFLGYGVVDSLLLSVVILLANTRLYISAYFRMHKKFKFVIAQTLIFVFGMVLGLIAFKQFNLIWLPLMLAEVFAFIFGLAESDITHSAASETETKLNPKILKSFRDYGIVEFLVNLMTYFDKILIYPILGAVSVNVYFATTAMSKIVSLITNPLHGVLLSWINVENKERNNNIIAKTLKYCIPVAAAVSLISVPLTYFAVAILYRQYLDKSLVIIVPIAIGVGLSFASYIVKAILLKFVKSEKLLKAHVLYIVIFVLLSIAMSSTLGLFGFALANAISKAVLFIVFCQLLAQIKNKGVYDGKK